MSPALTSPASVIKATRGPRRWAAISPKRAMLPEPKTREGAVLKVNGDMGFSRVGIPLCRTLPWASRASNPHPLGYWEQFLVRELLDGVHLVGIEGEMLLDGGNRRERLFVAPGRILPYESASV